MASHMSGEPKSSTRPFDQYDAFNLPPEMRPLGAWGYFGYSVLFAIPILGLVMLIVFSFSDSNINRRNFARSYFCWVLLAVLCAVGLVVFAIVTGADLSELLGTARDALREVAALI